MAGGPANWACDGQTSAKLVSFKEAGIVPSDDGVRCGGSSTFGGAATDVQPKFYHALSIKLAQAGPWFSVNNPDAPSFHKIFFLFLSFFETPVLQAVLRPPVKSFCHQVGNGP